MECDEFSGELTFFNVLSLRGGRYVEDPQLGASRFNTSGWGVRFSGIRDCLKAFNCYPADKNLFGYVANHLNVGYDHSLWNTDDAFNPLSGTTFNSGTLSILL